MLEELGLLDDVMEADAGRVRAWTKALYRRLRACCRDSGWPSLSHSPSPPPFPSPARSPSSSTAPGAHAGSYAAEPGGTGAHAMHTPCTRRAHTMHIRP